MRIYTTIKDKKVIFGEGSDYNLWIKNCGSAVIKPLNRYTQPLAIIIDHDINLVGGNTYNPKYVHRDLEIEDYRLN